MAKYRVLETDTGYLVRYRLPRTIRPVYIPAETHEQVNYITGKLDSGDLGFLGLLYKNRARMARNAAQNPGKASSMILKALRQYFFADWGVKFSSFRDVVKKKYAKYRPFILSARRKPYGVSAIVGRIRGGGDKYYANVFMPVPTKQGVTIGAGSATVDGILKTAKEADPEEFKKTVKTLGRSPAWRPHLPGAKSEASIRNGSAARKLYEELRMTG